MVKPRILGFCGLRATASMSLAVMLLTGCGSTNEDSSSVKQVSEARPLVVLMGGNQTCGQDRQGRRRSPYATGLYRSFQNLEGALDELTERDIDLIASCYDSTPTIRYINANNPEKIESSNIKAFAKSLRDEADQGAPIFMIGHSYGGWLLMKTALELSGDVSFASLFTLDPISRVHCTYESPFGCNSAPQDIRASELQVLSESSEWWANFYQTETFYLHSSEILEADYNEEIATSHTAIDTNRIVWANIANAINEQM